MLQPKHTINMVLVTSLLVCVCKHVEAVPMMGPLTITTAVGPVQAGTFTFDEQPESFTLAIAGTAVLANGTGTLNIGTDWHLMLTLSLSEMPGPDFVTIGGAIQHLNPPDDALGGHTTAGVFRPGLVFVATEPVTFMINPPSTTVTHPPHFDIYTNSISGIVLGRKFLAGK